MYIPDHFKESNTEVLQKTILQHPFGALITNGKSGLDANHIPFELATDQGQFGTLQAHVARANRVWQDVAENEEVFVIFNAGNAYISPSWYPSKHEHHMQVPTWNYVVVHAHGRIRIRDDVKFVRLTRTHEAHESTPWKMGDAPIDYLDEQLQHIVGIEIEITKLDGKRKLGQHKDARDIRGPAEALNVRGNYQIGDAMLECAAKKTRISGLDS